MRILWVKAGGLLPLNSGGRIRSYQILRQLARNHPVTFFGFHAREDDPAQQELEKVFEQVVRCPLDLPAPKGLRELLEYAAGMLSTEPYNIRKYCRPEVARKLRALVDGGAYDVMVCDFLVAAGVIPWDCSCPKVLFTHNVEAMIWKRHYEVAHNPLWKLLSWREWRAMARAEHRYLQLADHVLAVSQADATVFEKAIPTEKVSVIPTGVDIEYFAPSSDAEQEHTLVFTGSMDWLPNEDGIFYFADEILPRISEQLPSVKLTVVGRKPSRRLEALAAARPQQIQLTGWVEDVRPYLARGAVSIVPLRIGSGTRLKVFEAMAMAKAVVSTTIGAEGLPVSHGSELLLADSPEAFADSLLRLLADTGLRRRLGSTARDLVESKYSWAAVAEEFALTLKSASRNSPDELPATPLRDVSY
jgi:sugar transferase (PEP-CTERM/EpsH1 system associated)